MKYNGQGDFDTLKDGAVIGTSALRRIAAIAKYHPQLKCEVCEKTKQIYIHTLICLF
jgi:porphobilinogen deaminase